MTITFAHKISHIYTLKVGSKYLSSELLDKIEKKLGSSRIDTNDSNTEVIIRNHTDITPLIEEIINFIPRWVEEIKEDEKKQKVEDALYVKNFLANYSLKNEHKHLEDLYNTINEMVFEIPRRDKEYAIGTVYDAEGLIELYKILAKSLSYRNRVKAAQHIRSLDTAVRDMVSNSIRNLIYDEDDDTK